MRKFAPHNFHRSEPVTTKLHQLDHRVEGAAKAANCEKVASATPLGQAGRGAVTTAIGQPAAIPPMRRAGMAKIAMGPTATPAIAGAGEQHFSAFPHMLQCTIDGGSGSRLCEKSEVQFAFRISVSIASILKTNSANNHRGEKVIEKTVLRIIDQ